MQVRKSFPADRLAGPAAGALFVIILRGRTPGRPIPSGHGFGLWLLDDAGGDQHLERGGDHAIPIGASMDGFFGPPLTVMHGCAATGEQSGGDAVRGGGHDVPSTRSRAISALASICASARCASKS